MVFLCQFDATVLYTKDSQQVKKPCEDAVIVHRTSEEQIYIYQQGSHLSLSAPTLHLILLYSVDEREQRAPPTVVATRAHHTTLLPPTMLRSRCSNTTKLRPCSSPAARLYSPSPASLQPSLSYTVRPLIYCWGAASACVKRRSTRYSPAYRAADQSSRESRPATRLLRNHLIPPAVIILSVRQSHQVRCASIIFFYDLMTFKLLQTNGQ